MKLKKLFYSFGAFGLLIGLLLQPITVGAAPTFPGTNGKIAFTSTVADTSSIWTTNPDGTARHELIANAHAPVWSPDGKRIAFISGSGPAGKLQVMNADGTGRYSVRSRNSAESAPAWSRDGQRIAFVREEKLLFGVMRRSAVFTLSLMDKTEVNVSGWNYSARFASPSWSPDGTMLVYEKAAEGMRQLIIKDLVANSARVLTSLSDDVPSNVSWSPNGTKILFNDSANEIYTIWADGSHRTVISDGESYDASWSPDGKRIAFLEDRAGSEISISQEDGSIVWIPIQKETYREIGAPIWSPDGQKLAFTLVYADDVSRVSDIYSIDVSVPNPLTTWIASGSLQDLDWQAIP